MMVSGEKCVRSGWLCVSAGQIPPGSQEVWMPLFNFADEISYDCNEYTSSYSTLLGGLSNTTNQHNIPRYYHVVGHGIQDHFCLPQRSPTCFHFNLVGPIGLIFMFALMICNL